MLTFCWGGGGGLHLHCRRSVWDAQMKSSIYMAVVGECFKLSDTTHARLIGIVVAIKDIGRAMVVPRGVYSFNFWLPQLYQK